MVFDFLIRYYLKFPFLQKNKKIPGAVYHLLSGIHLQPPPPLKCTIHYMIREQLFSGNVALKILLVSKKIVLYILPVFLYGS